jgi:hypothetical protein
VPHAEQPAAHRPGAAATTKVQAWREAPCDAKLSRRLSKRRDLVSGLASSDGYEDEKTPVGLGAATGQRCGCRTLARVGRAFRIRPEDVDALLERASADSSSLATRRDLWNPTTTTLPRRHASRPQSVWDDTDPPLTPVKPA